ncbi:MAG: hypothetical protein ACP5U1_16475 [Desulfomonilaceae bacterium]
MKKENYTFCFVFAMGVEARPFLRRVEVKRRWKIGHATYREVFFEGSKLLIVRSEIGFEKAFVASENVEGSPAYMLSVGTCGALTTDLQPGDIVIASETLVFDKPEHRVKCSDNLIHGLEKACASTGLRYKTFPVVTAAKPIFRRVERETLHQNSGAYAVDMESHAIAIGASKIGASFGVIRVVSDGIDSPPLPDRAIIRDWRKKVFDIPRNIRPLLTWWKFLRSFYQSLDKLDKPLVELTRIGTPSGAS